MDSASNQEKIMTHSIVSVILLKYDFKIKELGLPGGSLLKNLPASAGDTDSIPGLGGSHVLQSN